MRMAKSMAESFYAGSDQIAALNMDKYKWPFVAEIVQLSQTMATRQ